MTTTRTGTRGVALALSCAAQFMVVLDIAIVNVALPSIQRDLGVGQRHSAMGGHRVRLAARRHPALRRHWLREALLKPLRPGSRVVVFSSGAAANPNGSPLSGGYAGAKATERFITGYAQDEANRAGLDITFTAVLPYFAPQTGVGRPAVQAYAARAGQPLDEYLQQQGSLVTPEIAGTALVELVQADPATTAPQYRLTGTGLRGPEQDNRLVTRNEGVFI